VTVVIGYLLATLGGTLVATALTLWLIGERGQPILPATRAALQQYGYWRLATLQGIHLYVYGCWPRTYIGILVNRLAPHLGRRGRQYVADHYHGKVLTSDQARAIVTVNRELPLRDLEHIVPYPVARELVLTGSPDIAVLRCPCRQASPHPCKPMDVCLIVGQPFVDLVLEHHPTTSRRLTQDEALEILRAEHQRGHVHSAWFKDACLNRFFAICNCCPCCCGGIQMMVRNGVSMMASSGYVARVDPPRCVGCGSCEDACPFHAIAVQGVAHVDTGRCMGCGVCEAACRRIAIQLFRDPAKGAPLDVRALLAETAKRPEVSGGISC
jgi:ferredoxin